MQIFAYLCRIPHLIPHYNTITYIGNGAFCNCSKLVAITFPCGIKSIGKDVIQGCTSLSTLYLTYNTDTYGVSKEVCDNDYRIVIKPMMDEGEVENRSLVIHYYILDIDTVSKMEYILHVMSRELDEYVDQWVGPHSLLATSYLFNDIS